MCTRGGYATLAGLAFTPDVFCCGVDIVGPAHLKTLLESVPAYWAPMKKMLAMRVGNVEMLAMPVDNVEEDDALNRELSPFYHADKIRKPLLIGQRELSPFYQADKICNPLLIGQGANDPRVKEAESNQMVSAMHKVGTTVEYILYSDEGHGFARPCNRIDFYQRTEKVLEKNCWRTEKFLETYCGGRAGAEEPEETKGHSAVSVDPASCTA
ncbi:Alpha/Beta hydrolase protein [Baffinella frigidus]|nr:Alpha/Beta hydrolase protein [Cryptophyta sp. CCMP2293]